MDNLFKIKQRVTLTRLSIFVKVNFKIQKSVKNAQDFALKKIIQYFLVSEEEPIKFLAICDKTEIRFAIGVSRSV